MWKRRKVILATGNVVFGHKALSDRLFDLPRRRFGEEFCNLQRRLPPATGLQLAIKAGCDVPRVLIADDNEGMRQALNRMFIDAADGWIICGEAANGLEAVQLATKLKPDVILLDFQMPVMNGLDAAREIAKNHPSLPIAMYTLHQNTVFEKEAKALGVREVISKADIFSALIPSLQKVIGQEDRAKETSA